MLALSPSAKGRVPPAPWSVAPSSKAFGRAHFFPQSRNERAPDSFYGATQAGFKLV